MRIKTVLLQPIVIVLTDVHIAPHAGSIKISVTKRQLAQFMCKHPVSYIVIDVLHMH